MTRDTGAYPKKSEHFTPEVLGRYVFIDLETGGTDVQKHPIIQVAAIAVDQSFEEIESIELKVQFDEAQCDPAALVANGYTPLAWAVACTPKVARKELSLFLRRHATIPMKSKRETTYYLARLAGHNVSVFDCPFLQKWYKDAEEFFLGHYQALDTYQLALWFHLALGGEQTKFDLSSLLVAHGIERRGAAHDALSDVRAALDLARTLSSKIGARLLEPPALESVPA